MAILTLLTSFDRSLFANLLKESIGNRSINQFALHCGVSAAYISRLLRQITKTPPNPPIIAKIAHKAHNNITYSEFMSAAGYLPCQDVERQHAILEQPAVYMLDLADILNRPVINYKGQPINNDTRKTLETLLETIYRLRNKEQNS